MIPQWDGKLKKVKINWKEMTWNFLASWVRGSNWEHRLTQVFGNILPIDTYKDAPPPPIAGLQYLIEYYMLVLFVKTQPKAATLTIELCIEIHQL